MLESNLEVRLLPRWDATVRDEPEPSFRAFVLGCKDADLARGVTCRYITIGYSDKVGTTTSDLNLANYYIVSLEWSRNLAERLLDKESFGFDQESQNHAFETIETFFEEEGSTLKSQEKDEGMGPKRIEVSLCRFGNCLARDENKRIVVTSILPPSGTFTYTIRGREWWPATKVLCKEVESFHSSMWWIKSVEIHYGSTSSSYMTYGLHEKDLPWGRVEEFYTKLTDSEAMVLKKWEPPANKTFYTELDDYGYGYYNYGPTHYLPEVADYRVSGDEIGAKIYLEQMERVAKSQVAPAEEAELLFEKKREGGEKNEAPPAATFKRGNSNGRVDCACYGLFGCPGCDDDIGAAFGAYPFHSKDGVIIH